MKFLDRIYVKILAFLVLIISIVLIMITFSKISSEIFTTLVDRVLVLKNGEILIRIIGTIFALISTKILFFSDLKKSNLENEVEDGIKVNNETGEVLITKSTISSIANSVIAKTEGITDSDIFVRIAKDMELTLDIDIEVKDGFIIKDLTQELQQSIKSAVLESTNIEVKKTNINVIDYVKKEEKIDEVKEEKTDA